MPKISLHTFTMGDVEDPYLYAAFPIAEWQKTEKGQWVMEHAIGESTFWCRADPNTYGFKVIIEGELSDVDRTYFELKWGHAKA
jgi:hypothetical protein